MIFHISTRESWKVARKDGVYRGDTLLSEGYIHCSKEEQVPGVFEHMFKGRKGLVLLCIDERKVKAEIKWESSGSGEVYPHIYGELNIDAVVKVTNPSLAEK